MAALGYTALCGLLIIGLGGVLGFIGNGLTGHQLSGLSLLLALLAVLLVVSVLRAMWVTFPAPAGRKVRRDQAPELFKLLDRVRAQTGGPRFDSVLIDGSLNVSMVQRPRLGLLGWYRNTLVLGLPTLFLLSPDQLASLVARECWHLRGSKGLMAAWVYRTQRCWSRLVQSQPKIKGAGAVGDVVFFVFATWFYPHFNPRAVVFCRQQELEADAAVRDGCRSDALGQALVALELASSYLDDVFWPEIFSRAKDGGELRQHPYRELRSRLSLALTHPKAGSWLSEMYKKAASKTDAMPSLRQRLSALNHEPKLPETAADSAWMSLLGKAIEVVLASLDSQWQIDNSAAWAQAVRSIATRAARLSALNEKRESGPLSSTELAERALCIELTAGAAQALPAWQEAAKQYPSNPEIALGLARLVGNESDEVSQAQAFALWSVVAGSDNKSALVAMERCIQWLERNDRPSDVQAWRQRLKDRQQREQEADEERLDFSHGADFMSAELTRPQIQDCLDVLIRERAVGCAYLVRKQTRIYPQRPFYVLMIERSRAAKQPRSGQYAERLRQKLNLPGEFMVIDSAHANWRRSDMKNVLQQIKRMSDARIYAGSVLGGR